MDLAIPSADEATAAVAWLNQGRLPGFGALVGRMVPATFEAYARVLHPASDVGRPVIRWSEVAELTGRVVHPLVQWHRLVAGTDPTGRDGLCPGNTPDFQLDDEQVEALAELVEGHTTARDDCWFVWGQHESDLDRRYPEVTVERDRYVVRRGPVSAAPHVVERSGSVPFPQTPGIWWPADHAWCVGSDADIDSSVVGGSAAAIAAVLADPRLEALPVGPHDSLMHDADLVN